ncbi:hypothetical protein OF83DRAFT_1179418, partial [Amylostereum chailletii]
FTPSGTSFEYYAVSIGARSQSAKTYLEKHYEKFADASLEDLVRHGLHALRETLQQDKELTIHNTSIGIIGPGGAHEAAIAPAGDFRIREGEPIDVYLKSMLPKEEAMGIAPPVPAPAAPVAEAEGAAPPAGGDEDVQMEE